MVQYTRTDDMHIKPVLSVQVAELVVLLRCCLLTVDKSCEVITATCSTALIKKPG